MPENEWIRGKRFYFLGIGGASMSALGKYVLECGGELYGYDAVPSEKTAELEKAGAKIYFSVAVKEEEKALINSSEIIVCTSAISKENARFEECVAQGKNVTYRGEFLGEIARTFPRVVSVAGSHGKTTCTSMCAHIFFSAGKGFTAHIGGDDVSFGNYYRSGDDYFLTEACEYKKNLLYVRPSVAVLLNIDRDHLECYRGEEELTQTFLKYCSAGKTALICADDPKIAAAHLAYPTFGINSENACFTAKSIINDRERYSFDFCEHGKTICRVKLKAAGRCHILNALAAGGAARLCGISAEHIAAGLNSFEGVKRRFEKIGEVGGAAWYCDYAHHPREISAVLKTAAALTNGKLYVVFQPHTYSRTKTLMKDFANALSAAENTMIFKEYAAREEYDEAGSAKRLAENIRGVSYCETVEELEKFAAQGGVGDTVLFLGAGDIYDIAKAIANRNRKRV